MLRELCDFLELEFAAEMLRSRASPRTACRARATVGPDGVVRLKTARSRRAHPQPPQADRGRWRHALSEHDVTRWAGREARWRRGYPPYEQPNAHAAPLGQAGTNPSMKVVLGKQSLATLGGTETYAVTVARARAARAQ